MTVASRVSAFAAGVLPRRGVAGLRDQLARSSSSIVLNIAEGCGRFARAEQADFYAIARGSAMECATLTLHLVTGYAAHWRPRDRCSPAPGVTVAVGRCGGRIAYLVGVRGSKRDAPSLTPR